jgi:hypothetical protein
MGQRSSPSAMGLALDMLVAVLLGGYSVAYWWRLPTAWIVAWGNRIEDAPVIFSSSFETTLFAPAVWVHQKMHPDSFLKRVSEARQYHSGG